MKFVPRQAAEGINVSREHPLKEAITLALGVGGALAVLTAVAIFFVDIAILFVPPDTEARILERWPMTDVIRADYDSQRAQRVQSLANRLSSHWGDNPYTIRAGILDQEAPNALTLPGGIMLVSAGLLAQTESENELAFVLGHEIGHLKNRDHLRRVGRSLALGLLLFAISGRDAGLIGGGAVEWTARGFDRRQETAADLFGLELVYEEYGHVADAWKFFERLAERRGRLDELASFLSTHPFSAQRIDDLRQHAAAHHWPTAGSVTPVDLE